MTQSTPGKITHTGNVRSRFDLFIVLLPEVAKQQNRSPAWCHRGDKYQPDPDRQLSNLIKLFCNHFKKYWLAELYDNTRPKNDPERIVLKYKDGIIEINRLKDYETMLQQTPLPDFLKY